MKIINILLCMHMLFHGVPYTGLEVNTKEESAEETVEEIVEEVQVEFSEDSIFEEEIIGGTYEEDYNVEDEEILEDNGSVGKATVCIEAFTVGGGYVVAPMEVDIYEDENCAYLLDRVLSENGLSYMSTGSLDGGFYLASISDILSFTPIVSDTLISALSDAGYDFNADMYTEGQLSEFDFTQGSGWMYCVNDVFPDVGFSEYYLQDGDVLRIQFTLAYGSDIGGVSGTGNEGYMGDFFDFVNKDELTKRIADIGIENCAEYMELIQKPDLTEDELSYLLEQL